MIIFCDFDGVICEDTIDKLFDSTYSTNERELIEALYKNGEISFEECMKQITDKLVDIDIYDAGDFKVDPFYIDLIKWARAMDIDFYIISSGDRDLIFDILQYTKSKIIANNYEFYSGHYSFYEKSDNPTFLSIIDKHKGEPMVYIGDGISDIKIINSHNFKTVYTMSYLQTYCDEHSIDHVPVSCLADVVKHMEDDIISAIIESAPKSKLLLSPGVVRCFEPAGFGRHLINMHRSESFHDLHRLWSYYLLNVLNSDMSCYTPCIVTGSGTTSMDIVIESIVHNNAVLFVSNGMFGERWYSMGSHYNSANTHTIAYKWGEPLDPILIKKTAADLGVKWVVFVHHDTSVGIHNSLDLVGELASIGVECVVDCVSSFAFYPVDFQKHNMGIFVTNPNKGLGSHQGIGIIVVRNDIKIESSGKYMDLCKHVELAGRYEPTNTPCMIAIHSSLEVLRTMSFKTVVDRYEEQSELFEYLYNSVSLLSSISSYKSHNSLYGCFLLPKKDMFRAILTIKLHGSNDFIEYCSEIVVIYPGKNALDNEYFQISLYGLDATKESVDVFLFYLKMYFTLKN